MPQGGVCTTGGVQRVCLERRKRGRRDVEALIDTRLERVRRKAETSLKRM